MRKAIAFILLFTVTGICFAQDLNDYKYVIIPEKFEFQKSANEYDVNNLAKFLFEKYGYEVYLAKSIMPEDVAMNRCKALYPDIQKVPAFLSTNVFIEIRDCTGKVLFTSEVGKSKEKDYRTAFHDAIRKASKSLDNAYYLLKQEKDFEANNEVAEKNDKKETVKVSPFEQQLFAQPIPNGYQLVDATPKVVLRIYKTSKLDSFTAISDANNGLVFKKGDDWYFEYYENDELISRKLTIKF